MESVGTMGRNDSILLIKRSTSCNSSRTQDLNHQAQDWLGLVHAKHSAGTARVSCGPFRVDESGLTQSAWLEALIDVQLAPKSASEMQAAVHVFRSFTRATGCMSKSGFQCAVQTLLRRAGRSPTSILSTARRLPHDTVSHRAVCQPSSSLSRSHSPSSSACLTSEQSEMCITHSTTLIQSTLATTDFGVSIGGTPHATTLACCEGAFRNMPSAWSSVSEHLPTGAHTQSMQSTEGCRGATTPLTGSPRVGLLQRPPIDSSNTGMHDMAARQALQEQGQELRALQAHVTALQATLDGQPDLAKALEAVESIVTRVVGVEERLAAVERCVSTWLRRQHDGLQVPSHLGRSLMPTHQLEARLCWLERQVDGLQAGSGAAAHALSAAAGMHNATGDACSQLIMGVVSDAEEDLLAGAHSNSGSSSLVSECVMGLLANTNSAEPATQLCGPLQPEGDAAAGAVQLLDSPVLGVLRPPHNSDPVAPPILPPSSWPPHARHNLVLGASQRQMNAGLHIGVEPLSSSQPRHNTLLQHSRLERARSCDGPTHTRNAASMLQPYHMLHTANPLEFNSRDATQMALASRMAMADVARGDGVLPQNPSSCLIVDTEHVPLAAIAEAATLAPGHQAPSRMVTLTLGPPPQPAHVRRTPTSMEKALLEKRMRRHVAATATALLGASSSAAVATRRSPPAWSTTWPSATPDKQPVECLSSGGSQYLLPSRADGNLVAALPLVAKTPLAHSTHIMHTRSTPNSTFSFLTSIAINDDS